MLLTVACEAMGIAIANAFKDGVWASLTKVRQFPWRYWSPRARRRIMIGPGHCDYASVGSLSVL